ncbi:MAG: YkgJ family cysteine cluster protein [Gammaproteobacteria bacterium]|nr:YkgJ family cysteine cluster protein [Gammaproteobacteria bacterium]
MDPDYDKFDYKFDLPFKSPVEPVKLDGNSKIQFNCHPQIRCFNECCKKADITLTPYDVLRLKQRLGVTSGEFLKKHTVPFQMDGHGLPGIKMRTTDNEPVCLFMDEKTGCSVYTDRPAACRYYPVGLMSMKAFKANHEEQHYFIVKEDHCTGHCEPRELTVDQYREEQGVKPYDEFNWPWYKLVLKKKSSGPTIGRPSQLSFDMFFMASYDVDRFRLFIESKNFRKVYLLEDAYYQSLLIDDFTLTQFGFRLLDQVLFGNSTIPLVANAYEQRYEERKEVIEAKFKLAEVLAKQEDPAEKYIEK